MPIIRAAHDKEHPYVMISRASAQNKQLSYDALGMLTYLLSQADDWVVVVDDLIRQGCKRDKVYRILNDLRNAGYLVHVRMEAGQGVPPMWGERTVHETPYPENPETVTPYTALPDTATAGYGETAPTKQESKAYKVINKQNKAQVPDTRPRVYVLFEDLCQTPVSPAAETELNADAAAYPAEWIEKAVKDAALNGATSWNYVRAMLNRWQLDGFQSAHPAANGNGKVRAANAPPQKPLAASTSAGAPNLREGLNKGVQNRAGTS